MSEKETGRGAKHTVLAEVRYSLRELLMEVQAEREEASIGQEIVDQSEITKLFKRKTKVRGGKSGE